MGHQENIVIDLAKNARSISLKELADERIRICTLISGNFINIKNAKLID